MIRSKHGNDESSMDEKIAAACRDAGEHVIKLAERTGTEVIVWRDGKIVRLSAARAEICSMQERSTDSD